MSEEPGGPAPGTTRSPVSSFPGPAPFLGQLWPRGRETAAATSARVHHPGSGPARRNPAPVSAEPTPPRESDLATPALHFPDGGRGECVFTRSSASVSLKGLNVTASFKGLHARCARHERKRVSFEPESFGSFPPLPRHGVPGIGQNEGGEMPPPPLLTLRPPLLCCHSVRTGTSLLTCHPTRNRSHGPIPSPHVRGATSQPGTVLPPKATNLARAPWTKPGFSCFPLLWASP